MPKLTVMHTRQTIRMVEIKKAKFLIGRLDSADLFLDNPIVSRRHAEILLDGPTFVVRNISKKNGTFVNSERIEEPMRLMHGDVIEIGKFSMTFEISLKDRKKLIEWHEQRARAAGSTPSTVISPPSVGATAITDPGLAGEIEAQDSTYFLAPEELDATLKKARDARKEHLELVTDRGKLVVPLTKDLMTIGKSEKCDIIIDAGWRAPKESATIWKRFDGAIVLKLLKGRVSINGKRLQEDENLQDQDLIEIEGVPMKFFSKFGV